MPEGQAPFPGYFDHDALDFAVDIVKKVLGGVGEIAGSLMG
ncbi:hypothetical protein CFAL_08345 [Corynebacterium falsenii DSM 44353]|nr:hypothetical protein [Corynebacterium falsenii]AHI04342.1 hypothetical protein CFAL_08345 [Corynebacterium falsenii DSM 44353]MDC7104886.1 hypothetical protein [Corynebacterium falsenii]